MKRLNLLAAAAIATTVFPSVAFACDEPGISAPQRTTNSDKRLLDRDFVSLQFGQTGGFAGIQTQLLVRRNTITATHPSRDPKRIERTVAFSKQERKQLVRLLNEVDFTKLVGNYKQENLADGFNQTVSLTTKKNGQTKTYTVENYGDLAPKGFYKVVEYLNALRTRKFPPRH